mmetsp:Transcript_6196/g.12986  ORF Transcript_6196/g.12986 Transcript_6196/m.12986 type:complete len:96 (-) Transcript_6196:2435-2722(-)
MPPPFLPPDQISYWRAIYDDEFSDGAETTDGEETTDSKPLPEKMADLTALPEETARNLTAPPDGMTEISTASPEDDGEQIFYDGNVYNGEGTQVF